MDKSVLITGITGQDGSYLAKLLLEKGYKVYGGFRRISTPNFWRLEELGVKDDINLIELDILDSGNIIRVLNEFEPNEIYNLASQSFVGTSFISPIITAQTTGISVTTLLESIRIVNKKIKFYQASSSEMFGKVREVPQNENTPFYPRSPYGVSKLYGHWSTINYRESFDLFACSGILFNHESELRGIEFVTRKISDAVARIKYNKQEYLEIGNLNAERDWGYAPDYVNAMWLMLQQNEPKDYVISTEKTYSIRYFIEQAFKVINIDIVWKNKGLDEIGVDKISNKILIKINKKFFRPSEVDQLIGNSFKAKKELKWENQVSFEELILKMVERDLERQSNG